MLTRQGWLVGIGACVLLLAGRFLGLLELFALGVVASALLIGCAVLVHSARVELEIGRSLRPARVHVGTPSRAELSVRNLRGRTTPVLRLVDPVSGTQGADLLLSPLRRMQRTVAAYRLPTDRRGIAQIGPLEVVVSDPFGLLKVVTAAAPRVHLTVLPHVDEIAALPYTTGQDPQAGVRRLNSLGRTGEEFYALRPYAVGDDLRRIHWPSSARQDELLVRQNELPWQGRTTIVLDVRTSAHRGESLELAVSAAASILTATSRRQDLVRLVTTAGSDSDFAPGGGHVQAIMEHLAVVAASPEANLGRTMEQLNRRSTGGALVVILADASGDDLRAIFTLRARYGSVTVVQFDRSAWDASAPVGRPASAAVLRISSAAPFAETWNNFVRAAGRPGRMAGVP